MGIHEFKERIPTAEGRVFLLWALGGEKTNTRFQALKWKKEGFDFEKGEGAGRMVLDGAPA